MNYKHIGLSLACVFLMSTNLFAQSDALSGKRIGVIGDSYVRNHMQPVEYTWHYKFAKKHNMVYFNYGLNGNCVAMNRARFGEAMYTRYKKVMSDSLDYVVVIAGHNDATLLDSIGGIDVYKERLGILCEGLIDRYPKAKIFFFTCWNCKNFIGSNRQKVVDATKEVCGAYSIPVFDAARYSGIHAENDAFRKIYFQKPTDTAHLNALGHDLFLKRAEAFLLQY
jgi:lysophospholipase L1-like esterase